MNIPEQAIEAAARVNEPAFWDYLDDIGEADEAAGRMRENSLRWARRLLEAAAPFIAAQALREAAGDMAKLANITPATSMWIVVDSVRSRADKLEAPRA